MFCEARNWNSGIVLWLRVHEPPPPLRLGTPYFRYQNHTNDTYTYLRIKTLKRVRLHSLWAVKALDRCFGTRILAYSVFESAGNSNGDGTPVRGWFGEESRGIDSAFA